ncbi:hypothetical protein [Mycolicibacterium conceptionense]|uniref:hypothetical protein n=1 Tax=Mycolicibacterium conceptionense TaxID=451644 RepID=UPI000A760B13|nr:hypothetical protein [Mycolicibacterium conceptionense]
MTRDEVVDVLTVVAAADRRTVGDADVDVWHAVLDDLPVELAFEAVRDHLREQPDTWIQPGHVYQRIRKLRRERDRRPSARYEALCDSKAAPDEDPAVTAARRKAIESFACSRSTFGRVAEDPLRIAEIVARQRAAAPPVPMTADLEGADR